jgi:hypothetical protein
MGEIADMMLEGVLCQECGVYIDDEECGWAGACGYPRYCPGCGGDPECNGAAKTGQYKEKKRRRTRKRRRRHD